MLAELFLSRFSPNKGAPGQVPQLATGLASTAVAQVEQMGLEQTRSGRRFAAANTSTGVAPNQTIPTTASPWALYNPEKFKAYVIDDMSVWLVSGTATNGLTVVGIVSPITATLPTAAAGSQVGSRSGGGLTSKAILATSYTLPTPAGNAQWNVIGGYTGGVPGVGGGCTIPVNGNLMIPPGYVLGFAVLAGTGTTPLYSVGITWTEVELDLE